MKSICGYSIILHIILTRFIKCDFLSNYFMFVPGKKFNRSILEETSFPNQFKCIVHCLDNYECKGVAWSSDHKTCQLGNSHIVQDSVVNRFMIDDPLYLAYGKVRYPVHFVLKEGYSNMNFGEAEERCRAKGSTIATSTAIFKAEELGMHRCNCGWIASGINVVALQDRTHNCSHTENLDGLAQCDKTTAGVWCIF